MKKIMQHLTIFIIAMTIIMPTTGQEVGDNLTVDNSRGITGFIYWQPNQAEVPGYDHTGDVKFQRYFVRNDWIQPEQGVFRPFIVEGWDFLGFLQQGKQKKIRMVWSTQGTWRWKNQVGVGGSISIDKGPPVTDYDDLLDPSTYTDLGKQLFVLAAAYGATPNITAAELAPYLDTEPLYGNDITGKRVTGGMFNTPQVGLDLLWGIQIQNEAWFPGSWARSKQELNSESIAVMLHECTKWIRKADSNIIIVAPSTLNLDAKLIVDMETYYEQRFGEPIDPRTIYDLHDYFSEYNQWGNRLGGISPEGFINPADGVSNGLNVPEIMEQLEQLFPGRPFMFSETGASYNPGSVLYVDLPNYDQYESKAIMDNRSSLWYLTYNNSTGAVVWHYREGDGPSNKDGSCGYWVKQGDYNNDSRYEYLVKNQKMLDIYMEMNEELHGYDIPGTRVNTNGPYHVQFTKEDTVMDVVWTMRDPGTINVNGQTYQIDAKPRYIETVGGIVAHPDTIEVVKGCTDPTAKNYDADATKDDGSCKYPDEDNIPNVIAVYLVDGTTDEDISLLTNNENIEIGYNRKVNARAVVTNNTGSVYFNLDGTHERTENIAPYSLYGDNKGNYYVGEILDDGEHTITVIPYNLRGRSGKQGPTVSITFRINDIIEIPDTIPEPCDTVFFSEITYLSKDDFGDCLVVIPDCQDGPDCPECPECPEQPVQKIILENLDDVIIEHQ